MSRIRLAFSLGDPNGIGPEVVLKSLGDPGLRERVEPVAVGSREVLRHYARRFNLEDSIGIAEIVDVSARTGEAIEEGRVLATGGTLAMASVERACRLCLDGEVAGMVTAPISKEAVHLAGHAFPGHTEFLARATGASGFVMTMVAGSLRVATLTTHIPLREVPANVTTVALLDALSILDEGLRIDFGIAGPRLAVLGLNPHAGDGGVIGREDVDVISPGIASARQQGIDASGPHPADAFFGRRGYEDHDAVLACYHDQGLIPFKTLAMGRGVNATLGLPIVRTSPDHGTAFDIAGKGLADPSSFVAAAHLAADIVEHRQASGRSGRERGRP